MSVALLLIFLGLMALGVPIAISLGAASVIVLITMGNMPLTMVVQLMYTSMNSFVMVAVPLFILAGSLMDEGGIADKIYDLAEACVGWIYGGLAMWPFCVIHLRRYVRLLCGRRGFHRQNEHQRQAKKGYPKEYGDGITCRLYAGLRVPPSTL